MSRGQTSLEVKGLAVKCHLRSSFSNLGQKSRGQMSLRSNVPRSNVTGGQMSRGQMSLAVKCPAVKCHLQSNVPRSNVPRSNVTCGQMSRGQMSLAVKYPAVKCQLRSNVTLWSNVPCGLMSLPLSAVKCLLRFIVLQSNVRGQMSRGQMRLWSYETQSLKGLETISILRKQKDLEVGFRKYLTFSTVI